MAATIKPGAHVIGITQIINSTGKFDGTAPTAAATNGATLSNGNMRLTYAADLTGGLFDFGHTSGSVSVAAVELVISASTTYTIAITDGVNDAVGNDVVIATGTTGASTTNVYVSKSSLYVYLLPGQKIRITTTQTAGTTWRCTVKGAFTFNEGGLFT